MRSKPEYVIVFHFLDEAHKMATELEQKFELAHSRGLVSRRRGGFFPKPCSIEPKYSYNGPSWEKCSEFCLHPTDGLKAPPFSVFYAGKVFELTDTTIHSLTLVAEAALDMDSH